MKVLNIILIALLVLFSIGAGLAKFFQVPQEIDLLQSAGLALIPIMALGILQVVGAVLVLIPRTRIVGCVLIAIALIIPAVLLFIGGNIKLGVLSLLSLILVAAVAYPSIKAKKLASEA